MCVEGQGDLGRVGRRKRDGGVPEVGRIELEGTGRRFGSCCRLSLSSLDNYFIGFCAMASGHALGHIPT